MKKSFSLLFLLLAIVMALASCEYVESQHNHKYSKAWTSNDKEHWRQASCEHTDLIVNKGEHTFDNGKLTKEPTEHEEGVFTYRCTVCDYKITRPVSRLPHTHTYDTENYEFNDNYHWQNATCEHDYLSTPAQPHNRPTNNVCIDCGHMAESENLAFTLLSNGTYELAGRGDNKDTYIVIPATYKGQPVTSIAENAFNYQNGIGVLKVVIPSSVTTIGAHAFSTQFKLEEVIFKGESSLTTIGDYAFYRCDEALKSFTVPKTVRHIGEAVFQTCTKLTEIIVEEGNQYYKSIDGNLYTADGAKLLNYAIGKPDTEFTVPDSVKELGIGVFSSSPHLQKIVFNIDSEITIIPEDAFYYSTYITEIQLPQAVTEIKAEAFNYCQKLMTLNIPPNLVTIGDFAFNYCTLLPDFVIPSTVKTIGANAFAYCASLTRIDIPEGVTSIGDLALSGCTSATEITIPKSLNSYGSNLFQGSSKIQNVTVHPDNTILQSIDGNLYTKNGKTIIYYCVAKENTTFTLPETVTTIGASAFAFCSKLQNIVLPAALKTIEKQAFKDCANLVTINLPEGLTKVEEAAFKNCKSISAITIPSTLKTLPVDMLYGCDSITSLTIPANITKINRNALYCSNLTSVEFVNKTGWSRYYITDEGTQSDLISIPSTDISTAQDAANTLIANGGDTWVWNDPN